MTIDGMPINNIKPARELPSNHLSIETEGETVNAGTDKISAIDGASGGSKIGRKEETFGEDKENANAGGDTSSDEETSENSEEIVYDELDGNGNKRYVLKNNRKSAMVQLYDNVTNQVLYSIEEKKLLELIKKISYPSGIIFSEKV